MKRPRSVLAAVAAALVAVILTPGIAQADGPTTGNWYALENSMTQYWAAVSGARTDSGAPIIQWRGPYVPGTATFRTEQQWQVYDPDGDGWFFLLNAVNWKAMGVSGGATANGSKVIQWDRHDTNTDQQWTFAWPGTSNTNSPIYSQYYLKNRKSGRCLSVGGGNAGTSTEGQQLIIWDCHTTTSSFDDQIWRLQITA